MFRFPIVQFYHCRKLYLFAREKVNNTIVLETKMRKKVKVATTPCALCIFKKRELLNPTEVRTDEVIPNVYTVFIQADIYNLIMALYRGIKQKVESCLKIRQLYITVNGRGSRQFYELYD